MSNNFRGHKVLSGISRSQHKYMFNVGSFYVLAHNISSNLKIKARIASVLKRNLGNWKHFDGNQGLGRYSFLG